MQKHTKTQHIYVDYLQKIFFCFFTIDALFFLCLCVAMALIHRLIEDLSKIIKSE